MAINLNTYSISEFSKILDKLCTTSDGKSYQLKENIGEGFLKCFNFSEGCNLYIGDFSINEDLRFIRYANQTDTTLFCITFQSIQSDFVAPLNQEGEIRKASEGMMLFGNNAKLNSHWHKNTRSQLVYLIFTTQWLNELEKHFHFPTGITIYLKEHPEIMLFLELTSDMRHNLRQMLNPPSELTNDFIASYMYNKSSELMIQASSYAKQRASNIPHKLHIHPNDLDIIEQLKISFINDYQNPRTIDDLVKSTGMSASKLQRLFKKVTNNSIYQFIKNLRMENSMQLLMQGHSVTEVCYEVGYSSIPNFSATFKEHFSVSPSSISKR